MKVNYEDERFQTVNNEKEQALNNVNETYNNMINDSNKFYEEQINASKEYADKQQEIQQAQTDFAIEKVEQQKEEAKQDYTKEQKGAYTDWQNASNKYGANAEAMATEGMSNSGYSESSQVSMYNTYQNRIATARESYNKAVLEYDNAIKEAQLQNSSVLAEIAAQALQQQLELALQGFQYKNTLLQQQLAMQNETEDRYYSRWQDVLNQINNENALAEEIRQYNESLAFQKEQARQEQANWEKEYALAASELENKTASIEKENESANTAEIKTEHYQGKINPDTEYGTFPNVKDENGVRYQPDNVDGNKLSNSGLKMKDVYEVATGAGGADLSNQSIWTTNGKYYYWDGSINQYIEITDEIPTTSENADNSEYTKSDLFGDTFKRNYTSRFPFSLFK